MNWQPIDTAPKDGTPILTNDGIVCYHQKWRYNSWVACDYFGDIFSCADEGPWRCEPKHWMPLPPLPS